MPTRGSPGPSFLMKSIFVPSFAAFVPPRNETSCLPALPSQSGSSSVILQPLLPKPRPE